MSGIGHSIETELLGDIPRSVRDTPTTRAIRLWIWNLLPAALCLVYLLASSDIARWENLRQHGVAVTAHVTNKSEEDGKSKTCYIDYTFKVGSLAGSGHDEVDESHYNATRIGDPIAITTFRDNTDDYEQGTVTADSVDAERRRDFGFAFTGTVIYVIIGLALEQYCASRRQLLREGIAVVATVVGRREGQTNSGPYWIKYGFRDPHTRQNIVQEISVTKDRYDRFPEGGMFTVLSLRGESADAKPYFTVTEAEIESMPRTPNV